MHLETLCVDTVGKLTGIDASKVWSSVTAGKRKSTLFTVGKLTGKNPHPTT